MAAQGQDSCRSQIGLLTPLTNLIVDISQLTAQPYGLSGPTIQYYLNLHKVINL